MNQIPKQMGVSVFFSLQLIVLLSLLTVITHGLSLKNIPIQSNHQQKDRNHPILCKDITIGVPKELAVNEKRVGLTPESVYRLKTAGYSIVIEEGAGVLSQYLDSDYIQAGASVVKSRHLWDKAGIVVKVQPPSYYETNHLDSKALFCLMGNDFAQSKGLIDRFILQQSTVFAMDRAPRDRPQSRVVDATFSQANVIGYRAVIEAANEFGQLFTEVDVTPQMSSYKNTTMLILGCGVAGMAAVRTGLSMGADVWVFDPRGEVDRAVIEGIGAKYLRFPGREPSINDITENGIYCSWLEAADIVITSILGDSVPTLITRPLIDSMKPGAVIVDLSASNHFVNHKVLSHSQTNVDAGRHYLFYTPPAYSVSADSYPGNCEVTVADKTVVMPNKVKVIGFTDMPSRLPSISSTLYSRNVENLLMSMNPTGKVEDSSVPSPEGRVFVIDHENNAHVNAMNIVHKGVVRQKEYLNLPQSPLSRALQPLRSLLSLFGFGGRKQPFQSQSDSELGISKTVKEIGSTNNKIKEIETKGIIIANQVISAHQILSPSAQSSFSDSSLVQNSAPIELRMLSHSSNALTKNTIATSRVIMNELVIDSFQRKKLEDPMYLSLLSTSEDFIDGNEALLSTSIQLKRERQLSLPSLNMILPRQKYGSRLVRNLKNNSNANRISHMYSGDRIKLYSQSDTIISNEKDIYTKTSRSPPSSSSPSSKPPPNPTAAPNKKNTNTKKSNTETTGKDSKQRKRSSSFLPFMDREDIGLKGRWEEKYGNYILRPSNPNIRPIGVIHFLGGAFVGAAPHLTYRFLLESLAEQGYIIVATPYRLDMDYLRTCDAILTKFDLIAVELASEYGPLPVIGIGHSCGALLQTLITSLFPDTPRAVNILISFNNQPASAAIPAFNELIVPISEQLMGDSDSSKNFREIVSILRTYVDRVVSRASASSLAPAFIANEVLPLIQQSLEIVDQVPPLLRVIAEGEREFRPTPIDTKEVCRRMYRARSTLLIKFENDGIDESADILKVLREANTIMRMKRPMVEMEVELKELSGTHITPLTQNLLFDMGGEDNFAEVQFNSVRSELASNFMKTINDVTDEIVAFLNQSIQGGQSAPPQSRGPQAKS